MNTINDQAEVVWIEGEISLLAEMKRVCQVIKGRELNVDLLFLTAAMHCSADGKRRLRWWKLLRFRVLLADFMLYTLTLLLLSQTDNPPVISVLAGGFERAASLNLDDLDLKKSGKFNGLKAQTQYGVMNMMALDMLAAQNHNVTFVHSWPGRVSTGNARRSWDDLNSFMGRFFVRWLLEPLMGCVGFTDEEAGQRHLFQCATAAFGGRRVRCRGKAGVSTLEEQQDGLFLVNFKCDCMSK